MKFLLVTQSTNEIVISTIFKTNIEILNLQFVEHIWLDDLA